MYQTNIYLLLKNIRTSALTFERHQYKIVKYDFIDVGVGNICLPDVIECTPATVQQYNLIKMVNKSETLKFQSMVRVVGLLQFDFAAIGTNKVSDSKINSYLKTSFRSKHCRLFD